MNDSDDDEDSYDEYDAFTSLKGRRKSQPVVKKVELRSEVRRKSVQLAGFGDVKDGLAELFGGGTVAPSKPTPNSVQRNHHQHQHHHLQQQIHHQSPQKQSISTGELHLVNIARSPSVPQKKPHGGLNKSIVSKHGDDSDLPKSPALDRINNRVGVKKVLEGNGQEGLKELFGGSSHNSQGGQNKNKPDEGDGEGRTVLEVRNNRVGVMKVLEGNAQNGLKEIFG